MKKSLITAAFLALAVSPVAQAAPDPFFSNLSGSWSGSGKAFVAKYGDISASCRVAVKGQDAAVNMDGSCGILFIRQGLGLSIRNVGGNKYVGTYTGSATGPARLSGTLQGNRLVMNITWGGVVNGDRKAQLVLERTGPNTFVQSVNDRVAGATRNTSRFSFKRR
jgi:hypothetical protein